MDGFDKYLDAGLKLPLDSVNSFAAYRGVNLELPNTRARTTDSFAVHNC